MRLAILVFAVVLGTASAASAGALDWSAAHEHDVVEILSTDRDGARRETKVWVAALDGHGYVRTNDSRWFQNLVRDPNGAIRFGGAEYAVFAEKYPISTWFSQLFGRTGGVNCLELTAREP